MSRVEWLMWGILVLDVLGFGGLIVWLRERIGALEGTVKAQAKTLDTVERLNKVVLGVLSALDPERWANKVKIHKELADGKVETILEAERRQRDKENKNLAAAFSASIKTHVTDVLDLLPYIPRAQRVAAIARLGFDEEVKSVFYEYAERTPSPVFSIQDLAHWEHNNQNVSLVDALKPHPTTDLQKVSRSSSMRPISAPRSASWPSGLSLGRGRQA